MTDWTELTARAGRAGHDLVGWMMWDADTIARWQKEWVDETTAVTVTLEVRNLPSDQLPGKSMQLSPERWSFRLAQAGNAAQTPLKVQMLGLDRFPASGDANHWRVAVQLIFPKQPKGHNTELAIDIPPEPAVANHLVMPVGVRPVRMRW